MREKFKYVVAFFVMSVQTYSFSCETQNSGDWIDASTWVNCNGSIPIDHDNVIIKNGHTVTLFGDTSSLESLFVEVGGDLNIDEGTSILTTINANANPAFSIDISNANVDLFFDLTINAQEKNIIIGKVNGLFDLVLNSSAETHLTDTIGEVIEVKSLTTDADGVTLFSDPNGNMAGTNINVNEKIEINDNALLVEDTALTCDGGAITFNKFIDSFSSFLPKGLTIQGSENAVLSLNDKVGATGELSQFNIVNSEQSVLNINTSEIRTTLGQRYDLDILLNSPTSDVLLSSSNDGDIRFGEVTEIYSIQSLVSGSNSLTVTTTAIVNIISNIGDSNLELKNLTINAANASLSKSVYYVDKTAIFNSPVTINNNITIRGETLDFKNSISNVGNKLNLYTDSILGNSIVSGDLSGNGNFEKRGDGDLTFESVNSISGYVRVSGGEILTTNASENIFPMTTEFDISFSGTLNIPSNLNNLFSLQSSQKVYGFGNLTGVLNTLSGSILEPGILTNRFLTTENVSMQTGSQLNIHLSNFIPRSLKGGSSISSNRLVASQLNLNSDSNGGATLNISSPNDFTSNVGDTLILIEVTDPAAIMGTFNGLPEASSFFINGILFSISYLGGDGNDVVLTNIGSPIIYVNTHSQSGDGQSWDTPYSNLQDALDSALSGQEIWVAQGVYYPDVGAMQNNNRWASFTLVNGVSVYGGFDGTETLRAQRNPDLNITILSGDIDINDINEDGNEIAESKTDVVGNNSFNIVNGSNVDSSTVLDGFTINAGKANNPNSSMTERGAGIYCGNNTSGPSLNQIKFITNFANKLGAAIFGCSQNVSNSSFINNYTETRAGAIYATGGRFENVLFEENSTENNGGALNNNELPLSILNSTFTGNATWHGNGGALSTQGELLLENVLFSGNYAGDQASDAGGAIFVSPIIAKIVTLTNVTMTGNKTNGLGGAIAINSFVDLNVRNSIIWNNIDDSGTGTLTTSVHVNAGTYNQINSLVQNFGTSGTGNLDENPIFIHENDITEVPSSFHNARLDIGSPVIAKGDDLLVTQSTDLDGNARIVDTVEMGAFEFSSESISVTVTGLNGLLILQNNDTDNLSINSDGLYAFSREVARSDNYEVSILSQNTNVIQNCVLSNAEGTVANNPIDDVAIDCTTQQFSIAVNVTGLADDVTLKLIDYEIRDITNNGLSYLPYLIYDGLEYEVEIHANPTQPNQTCSITSGNGIGVVNGADVIIDIECVTNQYHVGGTLIGLQGDRVLIEINDDEQMDLVANGDFQFNEELDDLSSFVITVSSNPSNPNQSCVVTGGNSGNNDGSGTLAGTDYEGIIVTCTTNQYFVGGTVTGIAKSNSVTLMHETDELTINDNGSFVFLNPLTDESNYLVTIISQPTTPNQTCEISNESGIISGNDVTDIELFCTTNSYFIGGIVTGLLSNNSMMLQNNGSDNLSIIHNGGFVFNNPIIDEENYSVTISSEAGNPIQPCSINNGSNSVSGNDVIDIEVNCEVGDDFIFQNGFDQSSIIIER